MTAYGRRLEWPLWLDPWAGPWRQVARRRLLFGLRLWLAVCLSLYLSFWLQLDNAYWSAVSAAVVCQPSVAASLRKGVFRLLGTVAGALAAVALAAFCLQDRVGFLLGIALWGGGCGFLSAVLRDQASYAAALAGYSAAIVAGAVLDPAGQANHDVFTVALTRASEIWIGVIAGTIVFVATDVGDARERLTESFAGLARDIRAGVMKGIAPDGRALRRDGLDAPQLPLLARAVGLDSQITEALGEEYDLRGDAPTLRAGGLGFIAALANWRMAAGGLSRLQEGQPIAELACMAFSPAMALLGSFEPREGDRRDGGPLGLRRAMRQSARELLRVASDDHALQATAIAGAEGLLGLARAMDALAALKGSRMSIASGRVGRSPSLDLLPAVIVAARVVLAIGGVELFWVESAWPDGGSAIAYTAVSVILFSSKGPQGYAAAMTFMLGCGLGVLLGGVVRFALLPFCLDFGAFGLALALVLVPLGALSMRPGNGAFFTFAAVNFGVGLNAENVMSYDVGAFYNQWLAIVVGSFAAAAAIALFPPLSAETLIRRVTEATSRDMRELAAGRLRLNLEEWGQRVNPRLPCLLAQADPRLLSRLALALLAGAEIIRLRRIDRRLRSCGHDLTPAFAAMARDDWAGALALLGDIDDRLAAVSINSRSCRRVAARAHGAIRGLLYLFLPPGAGTDIEVRS